jgi:hypothetical protein
VKLGIRNALAAGAVGMAFAVGGCGDDDDSTGSESDTEAYRREPIRECKVDKRGRERCKVTSWRLVQWCS